MAISQLRMPRVSRSCCGCSLETGCKIIGYGHLLAIGAVFVLALFFAITRSMKKLEHDEHEFPQFKSEVFSRTEAVVVSLVHLGAVSSALIHGINKKDAKWMEPFMLTKGVLLFIFLLELVNEIYARVIGWKHISIFIQLAFCGLDAYMFVIVYNQYQDLKEKFGNTWTRNP